MRTTLALLFAAAAASAAPPNVVLILADDLGINDLHCYGRADHRTPNLDRLAADGLRLTNAYAAASICSPTRAALLTGKHPARLHITTFLPGRPDAATQKLLHPKIAPQLPLEETTLAERLKAAGYATACVGKWHLGGPKFGPAAQGFDVVYAGQANHAANAAAGSKGENDLTAKAIEFIANNKDRPFFLYLPHNTPHIPYTTTDAKKAANAAAFEPVYAGVIQSMDTAVGRLLQALDDLALRDNTVVIFTSDNGGLHVPELTHDRVTHNTPYRAGKGYLYEGGLRVPAIVRWPGKVPAGKTCGTPLVSTDWTPTLLALLGLPATTGLDGTDQSAALLKATTADDRTLYWHQPHYTNQGGRPSGAVRRWPWKLVEQYDGGAELYDLEVDVGEAADVAKERPDTVRELSAALAAWRKLVGAQANAPNPAFDPAGWAALFATPDPSRYAPLTATAEQHAAMRAWRKRMDAAVKK